jgi:hypothetical protein
LKDIWVEHPELRWVLFHPLVTNAVSALLGNDFVYLRESGAHLNKFGGWHTDIDSQERMGYDFHFRKDYLMVQLAFYLQDNSEEFGGGLDVHPGSHRFPSPYLRKEEKKRSTWQRLFQKESAELSIPSCAGDLLLFHTRISHRATQRKVEFLPPGREKLAIFQLCSVNRDYVSLHHEFLRARPDTIGNDGLGYPRDLVEEAKRFGVRLLE